VSGAGESSDRVADAAPPLAVSLVRLARPQQWFKSVFVLLGPIYHLTDLGVDSPGVWAEVVRPAIFAAVVFALASSACYVLNDVLDAERDRSHPRKRRRPVASGAVSTSVAVAYALALYAAAAACLLLIPSPHRLYAAIAVAAYVANVNLYSFALKRVAIADVMGLSLGFVIRVAGGCAAVGIAPTTWLLNTVFFLAMFLAFGKRLGERRTLGDDAARARHVQSAYTDDMLRMAVVVTAVTALFTYAAYTGEQTWGYALGFNALWLTVIPATYGLLRCLILLERGAYDDPTELAIHDRPFQLAAIVFVAMTAAILVLGDAPQAGAHTVEPPIPVGVETGH